MLIPKSMMERAAVLCLAAWFALLTVLVQGPHRHGADGYGVMPDSHPVACGALDTAANAVSCGERIQAGEPSLRRSPGETEYCAACLFLKNCNERAINLHSFLPVLVQVEQIVPSPDLHNASRIIDASFPRAPPVSSV